MALPGQPLHKMRWGRGMNVESISLQPWTRGVASRPEKRHCCRAALPQWSAWHAELTRAGSWASGLFRDGTDGAMPAGIRVGGGAGMKVSSGQDMEQLTHAPAPRAPRALRPASQHQVTPIPLHRGTAGGRQMCRRTGAWL